MNKNDGLKIKYNVYKIEDGSVVNNCLVLRPDKDPAAWKALITYANATSNLDLKCDLYEWLMQIKPDEVGEVIFLKNRTILYNLPESISGSFSVPTDFA